MNKAQNTKNPNLFLVGFMGTGKSVVGRKVARLLQYPFLDTDEAIEDKEGLTVPQIFSHFGEQHFRDLEWNFLNEQMPSDNHVVSCGGGLITQPRCLDYIKKNGVVVVLYASIDTIFDRISGDTNRPLMQVENPRAVIEKLLEERDSIYRDAGVGIMTEGHTISEVAEHIARIYTEKSS
jgi:shikimate kinase